VEPPPEGEIIPLSSTTDSLLDCKPDLYALTLFRSGSGGRLSGLISIGLRATRFGLSLLSALPLLIEDPRDSVFSSEEGMNGRRPVVLGDLGNLDNFGDLGDLGEGVDGEARRMDWVLSGEGRRSFSLGVVLGGRRRAGCAAEEGKGEGGP